MGSQDDDSTGLVMGVVFGVIALVLSLVIGVTIYQKNKTHEKAINYTSYPLSCDYQSNFWAIQIRCHRL